MGLGMGGGGGGGAVGGAAGGDAVGDAGGEGAGEGGAPGDVWPTILVVTWELGKLPPNTPVGLLSRVVTSPDAELLACWSRVVSPAGALYVVLPATLTLPWWRRRPVGAGAVSVTEVTWQVRYSA